MNPGLAHYQLLRRLRQQLRHHSHMDVVYLFSDYELANHWLVSELDAHLRARSMRLQVLRPASAGDLPTAVLEPLLSPDKGMTGMPCWLAMSEPHAEWDSYRDKVLARLNENRSVLGRNKSFIFLVLPAHFEARAAEIAPDLWSVRSASYVVPPWRTGDQGGHINIRAPMPVITAQGHSEPAPPEALVEQRWKKQWDQWSRNRGQQLSPILAWQLIDQLRERHQPANAQVFAAQALEISRQLKTLTGDAPQSLRDLSVSLDKVGNVARDLGQLEVARSAYAEALDLVKRLRDVLISDRELAPFEQTLTARLQQIDDEVS